jgi:hypothetical protein
LAPPFTGIAVNKIGVPAQVGFDEALMETLETTVELTFSRMLFDVAGFPVAHNRFDVRWHVI